MSWNFLLIVITERKYKFETNIFSCACLGKFSGIQNC